MLKVNTRLAVVKFLNVNTIIPRKMVANEISDSCQLGRTFGNDGW